MKELEYLLWQTDKLEFTNNGATHCLKFTLHTPKDVNVSEFEASVYSDLNHLLHKAILFVNKHSKTLPINHKLKLIQEELNA
jgi:hypothetical protein